MEHYQTHKDFDQSTSYVGGYPGGIGDDRVDPGDPVIVNFGTGDRAATYLGKTGSNCSGSRIIHVRDQKTRKQMAVRTHQVRVA